MSLVLTLAQETKAQTPLHRFRKWTRLEQHAFWNSLAQNVASPFVGFNVTASGAGELLIGYVQAINNLASAVPQLIGGRFADRTGKRVKITVLFSVLTGLLWLGSASLQSPTFLAIAFTIITLSLGFYTAGWTSIIGEASEGTGKGVFLATFATLASLGGLIALVVTTILTAVLPSYALLYALSGGFFLLSALVLRGQKEQSVQPTVSFSRRLKLNPQLKAYYVITGIYGIFWGFGWPLFTITIVDIVKVNLFEFSVSQMIGIGSTIAFQPLIGRLIDQHRRGGVFWGRMGLVVYPISYMLMTAPWQLYLLNVFSGVTNGLLNVAFVAYLYDISPAGERGRFSAEFNLIIGVSTMAGSLASAYALSILKTSYSLWLSLAYLYVFASAGRAVVALLHLRLHPNGPHVLPASNPSVTV